MPDRLPRNFHRTFIPERRYLHELLRYAASGACGTVQEIAAATGIPMGESTGKTPAIIDYARGMGLVTLANQERSANRQPELTPFGRIVLLEDAFLKEPLTQWIAHLNLCSPLSGAESWYQTFCVGAAALGNCFERNSLEQHLSLVYGVQPGGLIGPLVRMYEDPAAFSAAGALSETDGHITRDPAPTAGEYARAYGAWLLQMMATHFPTRGQVTTAELEAVGGWWTIPGWNSGDLQRVLLLVEQKGLFAVDRQMDPWILRPTAAAGDSWRHIFDDLL
ncbi:MAG: hypothetical protein ACYC63_00450 [Armatimonadota bacterium]